MKKIFVVIWALSLIAVVFPSAFAEPSVSILMDQTTFSYGEKLVYTIKVSELTGDFAIIHIRDEAGKGSSAVPVQISELDTQILSPFPFDKEIFPTGKYYIDIEYSGSKDTAEFNVVDLGKTVFPFWLKQIGYSWINGDISDGALIDAIQKSDNDKWNAIIEIDENNFDSIHIPKWVKTTTTWWLEEKISDDDFANAIQYLVEKEIILL
jgi:hypothetical protein